MYVCFCWLDALRKVPDSNEYFGNGKVQLHHSIKVGREKMKAKPALVFLAVFFVIRIACLEGQSFLDDAFDAMDRAIAESETEYTAQDEYYLGRAAAAHILNRYRPYTANPQLTSYLNRICRTIVINSPQPEIYKGYYVIILDSPEYNAFATTGGHIFITKALVEAAPSEDALAAIIAHEIAHIQLKHGIAILNNLRFNESMSAVADRVADIAGKNSAEARRAAEFRSSVTAYIDVLLYNGYSQFQEFEADQTAAALLASAGYDPTSLIEIFAILQRIQGAHPGGFNTTHPSPTERIANLESMTGRYRIHNTRAYRQPRFEKILRKR